MTFDSNPRLNRLEKELLILRANGEELLNCKKKKAAEFFAKWGRERELPYFTSIPGIDCTSPRDGKKILKSFDSMFLAMLLYRSATAHQVIEAHDTSGTWRYFPDVAGAENSLIHRGMAIKSRLNRSSLRMKFRDSFLVFRKWVSGREPADHDHFIEDTRIRSSKSLGNKALWKYGARLARPFSEAGDSLVDHLHKVPFFEWLPLNSTTPPPLKHGEIYCPLDGPVIPIKGRERTPEFSWENLCGREWNLYLCPKCLGIFDSRLGKMN